MRTHMWRLEDRMAETARLLGIEPGEYRVFLGRRCIEYNCAQDVREVAGEEVAPGTSNMSAYIDLDDQGQLLELTRERYYDICSLITQNGFLSRVNENVGFFYEDETHASAVPPECPLY
ncbi:MAG: hypothetical protein KAT77_03870 [Nanoarchaeota archaeon]|nr:hypothetical protein [Nanoarchaeota archaeon]